MFSATHHRGAKMIVFALSTTFLTSCASIFSPRNQKLHLTSAPGATILYEGDSIGTGSAYHKFDKNMVFHSLETKKEGAISRSYGFDVQRKLGATAAFAAIDLLSFLLSPVVIAIDLGNPKVHRFNREHILPELKELNPRQRDEKYLLVNHTAFDVPAKDVLIKKYSSVSNYRKSLARPKGKEGKAKKIGTDDLLLSNSIFTDELNYTLYGLNFIDTSKGVFTDANNTLYIDAKIRKVTITRIARGQSGLQIGYFQNELVSVEMENEWRVLDYYKQPIFTTTSSGKSDLYMVQFMPPLENKDQLENKDNYGYSKPIKNCIAQNFEFAFVDLRKELAEKGLLKVSARAADTSADIVIKRPPTPGESARMNEMLRSAVTIKTLKGHGSGIMISSDGYLVTNYHVVAGETKPEVIFNDGSQTNATVIKVNTGADLALLRVEKNISDGLPFTDVLEPEAGTEVWAMGTPSSLELGQSISKGIVSGIRAANGMNYLQTDAKVSPGNSGGALINRKGEIFGIVTMKLIGTGTEGVGFAIPTSEVLKKLKIRYSQH